MSHPFTLTTMRHKAFGLLATLTVPGQPARRFTCQEALIVSRALAAVLDGRSAEPQIYMSPMASDHDFEARVREDGIALVAEGSPEVDLDRPMRMRSRSPLSARLSTERSRSFPKLSTFYGLRRPR
jgi:hypothetical protein